MTAPLCVTMRGYRLFHDAAGHAYVSWRQTELTGELLEEVVDP